LRNDKKAEEIAAQRVHMLAPLLAEGLDAGQAKVIKTRICEQTGISERTLRRYLDLYRKEGFNGLKPKGRGKRCSEEAVPINVLEQAILLRRQVPSRSISQIIQIMEWEGLVQPGQIKRSTLQEKLAQRGYSSRQMRMYTGTGVAARRYQQKYRNQLWHSDIKYGPYLPIGKEGKKKQVYLVTFVDDATRFILHGEFYPVLDQIIVEDCFKKAILKYGVPEKVYFDNGGQYRNKWMNRACAKMGIRLLFAKPYSPEATGKVERFNRVVDSFLAEARLEEPQTLDRLNQLFTVWLEECYQHKPHSGIEGELSPAVAYQSAVSIHRVAAKKSIKLGTDFRQPKLRMARSLAKALPIFLRNVLPQVIIIKRGISTQDICTRSCGHFNYLMSTGVFSGQVHPQTRFDGGSSVDDRKVIHQRQPVPGTERTLFDLGQLL
jgi:putative transposase